MIRSVGRFAASFLLVAVIAGTGSASAQVVITQARALAGNVTPGDTPGFPVTLSVRDSYVLGSNLTVPDANTTAVQITADNVTLDLRGFGIYGPGVVGQGHGVRAVQSNITVMNGSVRGMGGGGVYLSGNSHRVENMYVTANGLSGIGIGSNSIVRGNTLILNNSSGISLAAIVTLSGGPGTIIMNNTVSNNTGAGIWANNGALVTGNTVRSNSSVGLSLSVDTGFGGNVATGNNAGAAQVQGGIQLSSNVCGATLCP
jgi:hypothetical protein